MTSQFDSDPIKPEKCNNLNHKSFSSDSYKTKMVSTISITTFVLLCVVVYSQAATYPPSETPITWFLK